VVMAEETPGGEELRTAVRPPVEPMLAQRVAAIPSGEGWLYEPKWDGFRALVFFDGTSVYLQSRDRRPFNRYFPELVEALPGVLPGPLVLDGEIVIAGERGLDFEALLQRIHPAESRVRMLARETPASFVAFDLLAEGEEPLLDAPLEERRARLERAVRSEPPLAVTPATRDAVQARDWFERFEGAGLDGVIAKRLDEPYRPGVRGWQKIKHLREADCVVGGLRWAKGKEERAVGSLLLGLYDEAGVLHYVGHTSSFTGRVREELAEQLTAFATEDEGAGFGRGRTPGGPSRWRGEGAPWVRLRPELVCEVLFDYLQGDRFRHGTTFHRWRPDKAPEECTYERLETPVPAELREVFGG
jgi:ATP-dependent DNA ligase